MYAFTGSQVVLHSEKKINKNFREQIDRLDGRLNDILRDNNELKENLVIVEVEIEDQGMDIVLEVFHANWLRFLE